MGSNICWAALLIAAVVPLPGRAQEMPPAPLQGPWEGVPERYRKLPVGQFEVPTSVAQWKAAREKVKRIVISSLGEVPPRPSPLNVRVVSTDQKDGYRIEKFVFDNGVDSMVPGYLAVPDQRGGRLPAILTMHGHSSTKDNMFGYQPTSQDVAGLLSQ